MADLELPKILAKKNEIKLSICLSYVVESEAELTSCSVPLGRKAELTGQSTGRSRSETWPLKTIGPLEDRESN